MFFKISGGKPREIVFIRNGHSSRTPLFRFGKDGVKFLEIAMLSEHIVEKLKKRYTVERVEKIEEAKKEEPKQEVKKEVLEVRVEKVPEKEAEEAKKEEPFEIPTKRREIYEFMKENKIKVENHTRRKTEDLIEEIRKIMGEKNNEKQSNS